MTSATNALVHAILEDHRLIEKRLERVARATDSTSKERAFRELVRTLTAHETAEEIVVHPLIRKTEGGHDVVRERVREEGHGKKLLSELEHEDVTAHAFDSKFKSLRTAVIEHAEKEEATEHPRLESVLSAEESRRAARRFRQAERLAPTHPHPYGPNSRVGNVLVGPFAAAIDRLRDAMSRRK